VPLSPRAALLIAPALIVTAGAVLLSRHADQSPFFTGHGSDAGPDNMIDPSVADHDSARLTYQKQSVAFELLSGRCKLDEAADQIVQISESTPQGLDRLRAVWPGRTDLERAMAQVVAVARSLSRHEPDRFGEPMASIEAEAKALLGSSTLLH
jgi:hypothetical protein